MSQAPKLTPNLDQETTKLLNLTVLQRIDPSVEEILFTAAHVTLYEFNVDLTQWGRKDVEGSLFVVKRNTQPRFQFIVMNRRNTENLVENLLGEFEFDVQVPYLLYRNASQEVNGIWFYNKNECEEIGNIFNRILNAYSKVPLKSKISSVKSEFEELEAVPTMELMDGPLEPSTSAASSIGVTPADAAFVNFFKIPSNMGTSRDAAITGQLHKATGSISPLSIPANVASPVVPNMQFPSPLQPSTSIMHLLDPLESNSASNKVTNLLKPSSFGPLPSSGLMIPPVSSGIHTAPPLQPVVSLQSPYGAPMLQPFPPPTPPPSLTPSGLTSHYPSSVVRREKVRDALLALVQDDQFIDMFYWALLNAHRS